MKNKLTFAGATFEDSRIASAQAALDTDLSERTLTVDTAVASLSTEDRRLSYALLSAEGYPLLSAEGWRLLSGPTGDAPPQIDGWSQADRAQMYRGGSLYLSLFPRRLRRATGTRYELSLTSALGLLEQMPHKGGVYDGSIPAGDLIRDICGDVPVYVSEAFESVALYGFLPYVTPSGVAGSRKGSAKDNFLRVCFALNASVRANTDGALRVENLPTTVQSTFGRSRIYRENYSIDDETPVTSVTVLEHQYIPGTAPKTLFEGTTTEGQTIIFAEPCSDLSATGFSITDSGANYAVVTAGSGTFTGVPYVHITREVSRAVSDSDTENAVRIEDATLVGITNSGDVANRLSEYYAHRKYISCDAVIEFEDAGAVVSIWDNTAKEMRQACIEAISPLNFSRTLKGRVRALVDFLPWQTVPFTDMHVVVATSQTYTMPANLYPGTAVTAILIGGGQGGENGGNGGNGTGGYPTITAHREEINVAGGVGGAGGAAGAKGVGGKTIRVDFTVNPSDNLVIAIGQGGAVGGSLGGNTTITHAGNTYTSADGAANPYTDPFDGTTYGIDGVDGVAGGAGGSGGAYNSDSGDNGESTDNYAGGSGGQRGGVNIYIPSDPSRGIWGIRGGGGGGGASNTSAGGNASNVTYSISGDDGTVSGGNGANGANGSAASAPVHYGDGGSGGNGGGGGGGAGATYIYGKTNPSGRFSVTMYGNTGGAGGAGGAGSAGKAGCVILIYRKPIT